MKNIFKGLSIALIGLAFTSCVGDIDTPARGTQTNPENDIKGVYEGQWTVTYKEDTKTTEYTVDGTVDITPMNQAYAATVNVKAPFANDATGLNVDLTSPANVSPLTNANSYQVYNSVTPNGLTKIAQEPNGTVVTKDNVPYAVSTTFMGQVFPYNASGELVKEGPAYYELVLDFTYAYSVQKIVNRRPRNVDYEEIYHFVGRLKK